MPNPQLDCYYADPDICRGELWECQTCHEEFCERHNHVTDLGVNVECVACERARKEKSGEELPEYKCVDCGDDANPDFDLEQQDIPLCDECREARERNQGERQ